MSNGRRAQLGWRQRIQEDLLPRARQAATAACPGVLMVEFDWPNACFRAVVPDDLDCDDMVTSAIEAATGVGARIDGPPSYCFSLHVRRLPGLVRHTPVAAHFKPIPVQLAELVGLRTGLDTLKTLAERFPRCATFAMGGLPVMIDIAHAPEGIDLGTDKGQIAFDAAMNASHQRFHVHEGLLWKAKNPTPAFRFVEWLRSLPPNEELLIVDTTFSGGGIDRIVNVLLHTAMRPRVIEVHGLLDLSRSPIVKPAEVKQDAAGHVCSKLHGVPRLVTEDAAEIVGYDSARTVGGLDARWDSATLEVYDSGELLNIVGANNIAHTIGELLRAPASPTAKLAADMVPASMYLAILTQISNEHRRQSNGLEKARLAKLIDEDEWQRERTAIDKRFSALKAAAKRCYDRPRCDSRIASCRRS